MSMTVTATSSRVLKASAAPAAAGPLPMISTVVTAATCRS
jgi:hypothetical protein